MSTESEAKLRKEICELEAENERLRAGSREDFRQARYHFKELLRIMGELDVD
jgi:hypothetical protein